MEERDAGSSNNNNSKQAASVIIIIEGNIQTFTGMLSAMRGSFFPSSITANLGRDS